MNIDNLKHVTEQQFEGAKHGAIMYNRAKKALHETQPDCATWESKRDYVTVRYELLQAYKKGLGVNSEQ